MEKTTPGTKKLQIVIIVFLALNLVFSILSIAIVSALVYRSTTTTAKSPETAPLPPGLTTVEERMALFEKFRNNYNTNDDLKLELMSRVV